MQGVSLRMTTSSTLKSKRKSNPFVFCMKNRAKRGFLYVLCSLGCNNCLGSYGFCVGCRRLKGTLHKHGFMRGAARRGLPKSARSFDRDAFSQIPRLVSSATRYAHLTLLAQSEPATKTKKSWPLRGLPKSARSFDRDALGKVSWFIHISAHGAGSVICQQLQRQGVQDGA